MTTLETILNRAAQAAYSAGSMAVTGAKVGARALRKTRRARRVRDGPVLTMTRHVAPQFVALTAGEAALTLDVTLNSVQTSDLIAAYDQYKINYVDLIMMPRFDPAQSGVTNNAQVFICTACDPTGQVTTPTWSTVSAFDNHKIGALVAGKAYRYRFRPRAINALAAGNYAVNNNDWLILSAAGTGVAHARLLYNIKSTLTTDTNGYEFLLAINFSVKTGK